MKLAKTHTQEEVKLLYEQKELHKDHMRTIVNSLDILSSQLMDLKELEKDLLKEYNYINKQYKKLFMKIERVEEGIVS